MLDKSDVRQSFFGQKINLSPYNLCCINMFLRNTSFEKFDIAHGDALIDPTLWMMSLKHMQEKFISKAMSQQTVDK